MNTKFFGPDRVQLGWPDTEWAVLLTGMEEIHDQPSAEMALMFAADHNAGAAESRTNHPGDPNMPVTHAVVLRHGYAWSADVEHRTGRDCGIEHCTHCDTGRAVVAKAAAAS